MDNCITINEFKFKVCIFPNELCKNIDKIIEQKILNTYLKTIFRASLILSIKSFKYQQLGLINNDGSITYDVIATCENINPEKGNIYDIKINNINQMGALCKFDKVTIFIPNHFILEKININESLKVEILGKRIEENLVCVAKPVY